ncbi:MAG: hypothetical protein QM734_07310 [Cyclobacteriaceae bacterium]
MPRQRIRQDIFEVYLEYSGWLNYFKTNSIFEWQAPTSDGLYSISCTVKNWIYFQPQLIFQFLLKIKTQLVHQSVAYYPLNGDVKDYSGNNHNATSSGVQVTTDARGKPN